MKTLIIYESKHHGNTFKLVDAIEKEWGCDLCNIADKNVDKEHINFEEYDLIGIASGVAFGRLYRNIMIYQLLNSCFALNPGVYLHLEIFLKKFRCNH